MKRLTSIISSDSDSDEFDISKIKNKYKRPSKVQIKETTVKDKSKAAIHNNSQMNIFTAFSNSTTSKRKSECPMDNFVTKIPKVNKNIITPEEFFKTKAPPVENRENLSNKNVQFKELEKHTSKTNIETLTVKNMPLESVLYLAEKSQIIEDKTSTAVISPVKPVIKNSDTVVPSPNRASFAKFMHREGPKALGTKEIPKGSPNCLVGLTFVITGILDSIEREDAQALIERHGGKVTKAISGRTSFLVVGEEPGQSKVDKAVKLNTKQINEDELFDLIRSKSAKMSQNPKHDKVEVKVEKATLSDTKSIGVDDNVLINKSISPLKIESTSKLSANPIIVKSDNKPPREVTTELFVDKYRPTTLQRVAGQNGAQSPANKLLSWLKNFAENLKLEGKGSTEGSEFRAALLSGPPGVGKTTTAQLVCKQLGYYAVELNASNIRSKNSIKAVISESLSTSTFYSNKDLKHCLIMDEVDGMAGNEDRGGINELIQIIKTTRHPIICICNDRQSRKLQSFVKYVYDLRFRKLTIDHVKATLLSVACKEKIKIPEDVLACIVHASNFDIRQVLNNLQFWSAGRLDAETLESDAKKAVKEFKSDPFVTVAKVFSHDGVKTFSDKSDLFFQDYQLGGLFVQENYLNVRPLFAKGDMNLTMKLMSLAADSICMGDIIGRKISSSQNWGLLPMQAMFASVIPGEYLHGRLSARIEFPGWLGKFSKTNKNGRILTSLCSHLSLSTKCGVTHSSLIAMDYGEPLVRKLSYPLREGDIETTLNNLHEYQITKEDMDLLIEAVAWPHVAAPLLGVTTQTKSALTRAFNKCAFKLPYASGSTKRLLKGPYGRAGDTGEDMDGGEEGGMEGGEEEQEAEEEEDAVEADAMIVKRKVTKTAAASEGHTAKAARPKKAATKKNSEPKTPKEKATAKRTKK